MAIAVGGGTPVYINYPTDFSSPITVSASPTTIQRGAFCQRFTHIIRATLSGGDLVATKFRLWFGVQKNSTIYPTVAPLPDSYFNNYYTGENQIFEDNRPTVLNQTNVMTWIGTSQIPVTGTVSVTNVGSDQYDFKIEGWTHFVPIVEEEITNNLPDIAKSFFANGEGMKLAFRIETFNGALKISDSDASFCSQVSPQPTSAYLSGGIFNRFGRTGYFNSTELSVSLPDALMASAYSFSKENNKVTIQISQPNGTGSSPADDKIQIIFCKRKSKTTFNNAQTIFQNLNLEYVVLQVTNGVQSPLASSGLSLLPTGASYNITVTPDYRLIRIEFDISPAVSILNYYVFANYSNINGVAYSMDGLQGRQSLYLGYFPSELPVIAPKNDFLPAKNPIVYYFQAEAGYNVAVRLKIYTILATYTTYLVFSGNGSFDIAKIIQSFFRIFHPLKYPNSAFGINNDDRSILSLSFQVDYQSILPNEKPEALTYIPGSLKYAIYAGFNMVDYVLRKNFNFGNGNYADIPSYILTPRKKRSNYIILPDYVYSLAKVTGNLFYNYTITYADNTSVLLQKTIAVEKGTVYFQDINADVRAKANLDGKIAKSCVLQITQSTGVPPIIDLGTLEIKFLQYTPAYPKVIFCFNAYGGFDALLFTQFDEQLISSEFTYNDFYPKAEIGLQYSYPTGGEPANATDFYGIAPTQTANLPKITKKISIAHQVLSIDEWNEYCNFFKTSLSTWYYLPSEDATYQGKEVVKDFFLPVKVLSVPEFQNPEHYIGDFWFVVELEVLINEVSLF